MGSVQLFGILDEANRGPMDAKGCYNAPMSGRVPTMGRFVADYASMLLFEKVVHPVVLDWNQRIFRAAEAGDPQGTDQGPPQARRIG